MIIPVQRLDPDLPLPSYAHPGDAGADLYAAIDVELAPGERGLVPTGVAIALPEGFAAFVHPRSGLAAKHGLSVVNTPGTIDEGYRGVPRPDGLRIAAIYNGRGRSTRAMVRRF